MRLKGSDRVPESVNRAYAQADRQAEQARQYAVCEPEGRHSALFRGMPAVSYSPGMLGGGPRSNVGTPQVTAAATGSTASPAAAARGSSRTVVNENPLICQRGCRYQRDRELLSEQGPPSELHYLDS